MKQASRLAVAIAMVAGLAATAATVNTASAWGWDGDRPSGWYGSMGWRMPGMGMQPKARGPLRMMRQFDANGDGVLSKEELEAGLDKKINDNDTDGDQAVSLEEFKAEWLRLTQDRMVRTFQFLDRDGSGTITPDELKEPGEAMFDRMDRNADGKVDAADRPSRKGDRYGKWRHGMRDMDRSGRSFYRGKAQRMERHHMGAMPYHGCMQPDMRPDLMPGMGQDIEPDMRPEMNMMQQPPQSPEAEGQLPESATPAPDDEDFAPDALEPGEGSEAL